MSGRAPRLHALYPLLALVACGGLAESGGARVELRTIRVHETARGELLPRLGARCFELQSRLEARVRRDKARPVSLTVRRAPRPAPAAPGRPVPAPLTPGTPLDGRSLAAALRAGRLRAAFIVGLSGSGKTGFSRTLQALVCDDLPAVRVDLLEDLRRPELRASAGNLLVAAAARGFGLDPAPGADAGAALSRALDGKRWLLIADSLDALAPDARPRILEEIRGALAAMPSMRLLLLTRPPVFRPAFSLPRVRGVIRLQPQSCTGVDATLGAWAARDSRLRKYPGFATRYHLDERSHRGGRCTYRQLHTWRDLAMAADLARHVGTGTLTIDPARFDGSRAAFYRLWITTALEEALLRGKLDSSRALAVLDRMMGGKASHTAGPWPSFDPAACRRIADSMAMTGVQERCRHLFRARVFGSRGADGRYRFANRSVRDWFLARALAREAEQAGRCAAISARPERLESSDVPSFLLGMPAARRCLADTLKLLCRARVDGDALADIVDAGLPPGAARREAAAAAGRRLEPSRPVDACALAVLRRVAPVAREGTASKR